MSTAVARVTKITGNLRGSHSHSHRFGNTWKSLWNRLSGRDATDRNNLTNNSNNVRCIASASTSAADAYSSTTYPPQDGPRICILGGGFGGLYTAVKLEGLLWPKGTRPRVTLIDQADRFTFKPLLYELITGTATDDEVAPLYSQLLANYPITFIQGKVAAVQPEDAADDRASTGGGTVVLASGESLQYDWLVLSLGAETNTYGTPGVKEHAIPFNTYNDARRVVSTLQSLASSSVSPTSPEIVIVGGGYAGVELAAAIADRLKGRGKIQLVTASTDILEGSPEGQREAAQRALEDDGVSMYTSGIVKEIKLAGGGSGGGGGAATWNNGGVVVSSTGSSSSGADDSMTAAPSSGTADATKSATTKGDANANDKKKRLIYVQNSTTNQTDILEADLVVWVAGQAPVPLLTRSSLSLPFPTDTTTGATSTEPTLRVVNNKRVFALGDVAVAGRDPSLPRLPATAQVAFQQADYVAWNLWASINNRPLLRFSYQHLGDMMSLGATKGAVSLPIPVPPPISAAVKSGPLGKALELAGVKVKTTYGGASDGVTLEGPLAALLRRAAYLYRQPTDEQRVRVASSWIGQAGKQASDVVRQIVTGGGSDKKR